MANGRQNKTPNIFALDIRKTFEMKYAPQNNKKKRNSNRKWGNSTQKKNTHKIFIYFDVFI